jgi:hypothetical protein
MNYPMPMIALICLGPADEEADLGDEKEGVVVGGTGDSGGDNHAKQAEDALNIF